eukprot:scaffold10223_cov266-Chaetoceros_neogracile.AAC.6
MRRGVVNTFIMRLLRTTVVLAANISFLLSFLELLKSHLRDVIYHYDGDIDEIGIWPDLALETGWKQSST